MNIELKNYLIFALLFTTSILIAQSDRMTRDIEVAENILSTLLNRESNYYGNNVEGTYIEGHGALFTINSGSFISMNNYNKAIVLSMDASQNGFYQLGETTGKSINIDSLNTTLQTHIKDVMKTFITDYAQLLSQLNPDEKILLRYSPKSFSPLFASKYLVTGTARIVISGSEEEEKEHMIKELTAETTKSAIDDYKSGKISQQQLEERIKFSEKNSTTKKDTELELLASIFHRLYQGDLFKTFHMLGQSKYEKIEGLGAIFEMNFGAFPKGLSENRIYYFDNAERLRELGREREKEAGKDNNEEENAIAHYNEFLKRFKENIIEYGRTVKSLAADELLVFKIDLSFCLDCEIPMKELELSIKKSVLEDYDKNKISLEQAIEKITVKETQE